MQYFFLSDSWTTGRIWEFGGLWNELAWHRPPHIQKQTLCIRENDEDLWLYQAEDAILMVEVRPKAIAHPTIGQVVLKRLLSAEQVIERLCQEKVFYPANPQPANALPTCCPLDNPLESHSQPPQHVVLETTSETEINRTIRNNISKELSQTADRPKTSV